MCAKNLTLYNTLTRRKETFEPLQPNFVGLYVCGPTVYNDVHLGNCRTFLTFDILYRYLKHLGYKVKYVRNITDVGHLTNDDVGEDKIARTARLEKIEPMQIVHRYTNRFHDTMKLLNICPPDIEPTATGHIGEQIRTHRTNYCGEVSVWIWRFDLFWYASLFKKASVRGTFGDGHRGVDGEESGGFDSVRSEATSRRYCPLEASPVESYYGLEVALEYRLSGWHLECSAMSTKYLGETFDIHGGG